MFRSGAQLSHHRASIISRSIAPLSCELGAPKTLTDFPHWPYIRERTGRHVALFITRQLPQPKPRWPPFFRLIYERAPSVPRPPRRAWCCSNLPLSRRNFLPPAQDRWWVLIRRFHARRVPISARITALNLVSTARNYDVVTGVPHPIFHAHVIASQLQVLRGRKEKLDEATKVVYTCPWSAPYIDYRCDDSQFRVSASWLSSPNPTLLSTGETRVRLGIRSQKLCLYESAQFQQAIGAIYLPSEK